MSTCMFVEIALNLMCGALQSKYTELLTKLNSV